MFTVIFVVALVAVGAVFFYNAWDAEGNFDWRQGWAAIASLGAAVVTWFHESVFSFFG